LVSLAKVAEPLMRRFRKGYIRGAPDIRPDYPAFFKDPVGFDLTDIRLETGY
jgi:hypothetical protein